jgi:lysophospholipase L1-like esterase
VEELPVQTTSRRQFVFASLAVLFVFFTTELLLRALSSSGVLPLPRPGTVRDAWAKEGWRIDRDLNWALIPNHTSTRGGAQCRTNSHGLRDQEIPLKKPSGTYRILVLGDSTVLGFAIPFEKTFSEQLERMLNDRNPETRFQVINAGVPGYSLYNCLIYLKRDGIQFDPDLIILETNFNDRRYVMSNEYQDGEKFYHRFYYRLRLREILGETYLYRAVRSLLVNTLGLTRHDLLDTGDFHYEQLDVDDIGCRVEPERYRKLLGEMIDFLDMHDIPLILVPLRDPPSYVNDYYVASSLADAGRFEEAVSLLRELYKLPFYRIIVARKMNEFLEKAGQGDRMIRSIPIPLEWMSTDGNIPIYLSDSYARIMQDAARQRHVITINFDPLPGGEDSIYLDYIHLNEKGHRLLAEKLYSTLLEEELLP